MKTEEPGRWDARMRHGDFLEKHPHGPHSIMVYLFYHNILGQLISLMKCSQAGLTCGRALYLFYRVRTDMDATSTFNSIHVTSTGAQWSRMESTRHIQQIMFVHKSTQCDRPVVVDVVLVIFITSTVVYYSVQSTYGRRPLKIWILQRIAGTLRRIAWRINEKKRIHLLVSTPLCFPLRLFH